MRTEKIVPNVTYCEDVRDEIGGLQTFVGVMRGALGLEVFPAALTKFSVVMEVATDRRDDQSPVEFRVTLINEAGDEKEVGRGAMPSNPEPLVEDRLPGRYRSIVGVMSFTNFTIQEPCALIVEISYQGETHHPPGIKFIPANSAEMTPQA